MATKDTKAATAPGVPAMANPPVKEERKVEQINPVRMEEAQFTQTIYFAKAHANTRPTDLLEPAYWAHVAAKLKPWSEIKVVADDGSWWAHYIVLEAGRTWARVHMLMTTSLTSADVSASQAAAMAPYEVCYRGEHMKWSVVRKADHEVVHEGEGTQGGAIDWLTERLKAGM